MAQVIEPTDAVPSGRRRPAWTRVVGAVAAGLVAVVVGALVWFAVRDIGVFSPGWLAVLVGAAIGAAVVLGGGRGGVLPAILAVVLTFLASVLSQNFVQRDQLQDGIELLQTQWAGLQEPGPDAAAEEAAAAPERPLPPPDIVPVLPDVALLSMPPDVLAQIWEYLPAERRQVLPAATIEEVEVIVAGGGPAAGAESDAAESATVEAESAAVVAEYDIPKPVLECAPPPDFTQPDAAAGLGFPDGVPLILPLSDYYRTAPPRGDGADVDPPSPVCFAVESAKDDPLEAISWGVGLVAAGGIAALWRPRRRAAAV